MATSEALRQAIQARDAERVEAILAESPALAGERPAGAPGPLLFAAYMRDPAIVAALRAYTAPDACEAAALGDTGALRELLTRDRTAANARSGDGWTALHLAAFFGHADALELLLAHGADVRAISGTPDANTALHAALAGGADSRIIDALLAAGADVSVKGAQDYTPLHVAAANGRDAVVDQLLARGASPSSRMTDGRTPADLAEERGHPALGAKLRGMRAESLGREVSG